MLVVGLTGGIASGKSTVSHLLTSAPHSLPLIDLDLIARWAVVPGSSALKQLAKHFGKEILLPDGGLDRAKLGEIIFTNEKERKVLNGIMGPAIQRLLLWELFKAYLKGCPLVIMDVPLLIEGSLWKMCGAIVVVYCSEEAQLARLTARNSLTEAQAQSRISSQAPLSSKLKFADYVLDNSGPLESLSPQVDRVVAKLKQQAGWSWMLSWLFPPLGIVRGLGTVAYRLYVKKVGQQERAQASVLGNRLN